eukprot:TRINITY_DN24241_c0_g1_i1.p1 TRINITY_DN24241_c0_g1~~TRINITY_DN24241_c0_g1_i1.p1  ORF type:complete len:292 (-),score=55.71 TRINITY_DN24241_c0_g1_i1:43-918(-)
MRLRISRSSICHATIEKRSFNFGGGTVQRTMPPALKGHLPQSDWDKFRMEVNSQLKIEGKMRTKMKKSNEAVNLIAAISCACAMMFVALLCILSQGRPNSLMSAIIAVVPISMLSFCAFVSIMNRKLSFKQRVQIERAMQTILEICEQVSREHRTLSVHLREDSKVVHNLEYMLRADKLLQQSYVFDFAIVEEVVEKTGLRALAKEDVEDERAAAELPDVPPLEPLPALPGMEPEADLEPDAASTPMTSRPSSSGGRSADSVSRAENSSQRSTTASGDSQQDWTEIPGTLS